MLRYVYMFYLNFKYWKFSLDVKLVSRGGVGYRIIKLFYRCFYGFLRFIVCVSVKIYKR